MHKWHVLKWSTTSSKWLHGRLFVDRFFCKQLFAASIVAVFVNSSAAQDQEPKRATADAAERVRQPAQLMKELKLWTSGEQKELVELIERPLLTYGEPARSNDNGTLWAFGKVGRPVAMVELFQGTDRSWVHCLTLTSLDYVVMSTPVKTNWTPQKIQIEPKLIHGAPVPSDKETTRLRQMKDLARRFTAHEFWDPDNSRFELRLLIQPVHRYSDVKAGVYDGAAFIIAHGTNPEIVLLIEALGEPKTARWHFSVARQSSAEVHVELDGKEVWKGERTPGVVGTPTDPFWSFNRPLHAGFR
jgi:hypothetical protein